MKLKWTKKARKCVMGFGLLILSGCMQMSEEEIDKSAGLNGGFEASKNGLPVNWLMYTPNTVKEGEFSIVLDKESFKEGKQSLRFDVEKCSSTGGWKSPGFTNEFFQIGKYEGEGSYKIGFWIKNQGTKFQIEAGAVSAKKGEMSVLIQSAEEMPNWTYFEYTVNVAKENHLRLQLNILAPGTFWIDDLQIVKT